MKININTLIDAVRQMRYDLSSLHDNPEFFCVDIEVVQENPAEGVMVDCIKLSNSSEYTESFTNQNVGVLRVLEIYPAESGQKPRYVRQDTRIIK